MRFLAKITTSCIWVAIYLLIKLFYIGIPVTRTDGRAYGHLINKFSRMGLDYHICLPTVLRCARFARESSANRDFEIQRRDGNENVA